MSNVGYSIVTDGSGRTARVVELGDNDALAVAIVDGSGSQITSFGGGTQYTDGQSVATPVGTQIMFSDSGTERAVSNAEPLPVDVEANALTSAAPPTGQVIIAVTGTAVQFPSNALVNGLIITAFSGNTSVVTIGGSSVTDDIDGTGNGYILAKGASTSAAVDNSDRIYINGTAGDFISFIGS